MKQCGKRYSIFKFLRGLGIKESTSWNVVMYSQGWWKMSNKQAVNDAMNLKWFVEIGLHTLSNRLVR